MQSSKETKSTVCENVEEGKMGADVTDYVITFGSGHTLIIVHFKMIYCFSHFRMKSLVNFSTRYCNILPVSYFKGSVFTCQEGRMSIGQKLTQPEVERTGADVLAITGLMRFILTRSLYSTAKVA